MISVLTRQCLLLTLSATALLLSGCFHAGDLTQMKRDLERDLPEAHFKRQVQFTIGPMSLGLVRLLSLVAPNIDQQRELLKEIDRVAIAVYENKGRPLFKGNKLPRAIYDLLERGRWQMAVKIREEDELIWVLYQVYNKQIRDLYLVILEDDELIPNPP